MKLLVIILIMPLAIVVAILSAVVYTAAVAVLICGLAVEAIYRRPRPARQTPVPAPSAPHLNRVAIFPSIHQWN